MTDPYGRWRSPTANPDPDGSLLLTSTDVEELLRAAVDHGGGSW